MLERQDALMKVGIDACKMSFNGRVTATRGDAVDCDLTTNLPLRCTRQLQKYLYIIKCIE